jgi:hypothetical protein
MGARHRSLRRLRFSATIASRAACGSCPTAPYLLQQKGRPQAASGSEQAQHLRRDDSALRAGHVVNADEQNEACQLRGPSDESKSVVGGAECVRAGRSHSFGAFPSFKPSRSQTSTHEVVCDGARLWTKLLIDLWQNRY